MATALQQKGSGEPLPADVREPMEQRFGWSFRDVRVHTGSTAGAAEALRARAFTHGRDIHFARGAFSPSDVEGKRLLAHELAHVVQGEQGRAARVHAKGAVSHPTDPLELEAEQVASAVVSGSPARMDGARSAAPAASPTIFRYVDADGNNLPDPIELTVGGDPMRLEFKRTTRGGEPAFECVVTYLGPHPVSGPALTGKAQSLSTTIGSAKLVSTVSKKSSNSVDIDLYGDGTRMVRVLDEARYDDRPFSKGREHQLALKVNGKSVDLVSVWVLDPKASAADIPPSTTEESPGTNPQTSYYPGTNSWDFAIDGDGDQTKELLVRLVDKTPSASMGTTVAKKVLIQITQRSTQTVMEKEVALPAPEEVSPIPTVAAGALFPVVKQVTDGGSPTIVELTTTLGSAPPKLLIHPPERTATGVKYKVQVPGLDIYYSFPPEKSAIRQVFNPAAAEAVGGIVHSDIALGAYNDRFRLTLQARNATTAVLGLSPLYRGEPLGGDGVELSWSKPIVYSHKATATGLEMDLDNDGTADLTLFDRLTTPDSVDGGGPPESNRNHEVRIVGAAVGGEKSLYFRIRDGFPTRAGGPAAVDVTTSSNALAVGELKKQASEGSITEQMDAYENAMTAERQKAVTAGVLDKATFDAWLALSRSMIQLRPQKLPVDATLQARAATQADAFNTALSSATSSASRLSAGHGWWVSNNPYTGESSSPMGKSGPGPSLAGHITAGRWGDAFAAYGTLVAGLDRWIVDRLKAVKGEHAPETERADLIAGRRRELTDLEGKRAKRALATFQPDDKFQKEQGYVKQIPLSLYYWQEGSTWYLKNITNPNKSYHVSAGGQSGDTAPPWELFKKLDDPDRLPAGLIHIDVPGGVKGEIRTTDGLTWAKFFGYLSFGLAAIGLGLATFGTGTVAVAGAWVLAGSAVAGAVSAGIDLVDKARHGDLDGTTALLDLAQIVAGIAGATSIASSRIALAASNAPAGARWAGNWARLAVMANKVYIPAAKVAAAADVMSFAVISVETAKQLDEIEARTGDDPASRSRAKLLLLSQLAALAGLNALSIKGTVANLKQGRTLVLTPGPEGIPVATLALDQTSVVIDTNAAIALDRRARGLPLDSGHQAAIKRVEKLGADLRVADPTIAEMGVKGGNPTQKGVPVSVERTGKEYQDILTNLANPADPVGQATGTVDRQIVADTFFAITEPGATPTLATADKKIYNALSRRAGYDPNAKGAGIAVPVKFPDGFDVTINGRTIKVIPIK